MESGKIEGSDLGKNVSQYSIQMNTGKPTPKRKINTLKGFLDAHKAKDGELITHTRIPDNKSKIYGGKYNIPDEELEEFFTLYKKDIIDKKGKEYLTERQMDNGPIAIDLDSEALNIEGGTNITTAATGNKVTINMPTAFATEDFATAIAVALG